MKSVLAALLFTVAISFAQVDVTSVTGQVTDPTGAAVPGASVTVTNMATGAKSNATTSDRGEYAVPALPGSSYSLSVSKPGFKTEVRDGVALIVGVPGTLNVKLSVGQTSETVEVTAGAEVVQTATRRRKHQLDGTISLRICLSPRGNAIELLVDAPGTQTPTNPRSSTINGMPKGAVNITIDGMNTKDNNLKSSDGYFSYIMPSVDALEEVTLATSAAGVDSTGQGGAQIKFVTRSGTNELHGGLFWQNRNTFFNADYYFNNQLRAAPRHRQAEPVRGARAAGPSRRTRSSFSGTTSCTASPAPISIRVLT